MYRLCNFAEMFAIECEGSPEPGGFDAEVLQHIARAENRHVELIEHHDVKRKAQFRLPPSPGEQGEPHFNGGQPGRLRATDPADATGNAVVDIVEAEGILLNHVRG
jgi:hypothetical protein